MKVYVDLSDSDLRTIFHALTIGSNNCNSNCMHKDCKNCWFKKGVDSLRKKFTNPQSLADYTKQVRKEVYDKIYKALTSESGWHRMKNWYCVNDECDELRDFLDQIQD